MDAETRKIPSHEVTYARLRDMILFGHLAPGAPVTIQGLISDLGAGMTPVREAIRRLTAEGALLPQGNRRVAVPELSADLLEQVAFARLAIEPKLAELAAPKLTAAQIDRLEAIDGAVNRAIEAGKLPAIAPPRTLTRACARPSARPPAAGWQRAPPPCCSPSPRPRPCSPRRISQHSTPCASAPRPLRSSAPIPRGPAGWAAIPLPRW